MSAVSRVHFCYFIRLEISVFYLYQSKNVTGGNMISLFMYQHCVCCSVVVAVLSVYIVMPSQQYDCYSNRNAINYHFGILSALCLCNNPNCRTCNI